MRIRKAIRGRIEQKSRARQERYSPPIGREEPEGHCPTAERPAPIEYVNQIATLLEQREEGIGQYALDGPTSEEMRSLVSVFEVINEREVSGPPPGANGKTETEPSAASEEALAQDVRLLEC